MPAIEVNNLCKTYKVYSKKEGLWGSLGGLFKREYREVKAVDDISFEIEEGEMIAFLGPNGAGKTTTLKLLSGLIHPTGGDATVFGYTPWDRVDEYRRRFALVMGQKNQLWWDLPAQESFRLHKEIYRVSPGDFEKRMDELTTLLEVQHLISQPVRELSLGERMRMELIAALLHRPDILFLDEPTIGLDVVSQRRVQEFLRYYQKEQGITVLLTSHYMKDVEALCERAVVISKGKLLHDGSLDEILDRFSQHKIIELQFAKEVPDGLERFGRVIEAKSPRVKIEVGRNDVPETLTRLLGEYAAVDDVSVSERPLDEVIAELFETDKDPAPEESAAVTT